MKISACMIAKNEEKCIARCIESYKDIVNEIIVVDTGSTDRTVDIASSYGANVFQYEWNNDFARAKNFALEQAKGDWIIFLDADEYFVDNTQLNIPKVLKEINLNNKIQGIHCKFYHIDEDDNYKIKNSDYLLRIFRNHKKIRFVGNIHEEINYDNRPLRVASTSKELIKVYHTGYSKNILRSKFERNMKPLLDKVNSGAGSPMTFFYLSDCCFGLSDYENAIKYARLALEKGVLTYSHNVKPYINIITSYMYLEKPFEETAAEINQAIQKFPFHPDFYIFLGTYSFSHGKYIQSIKAYEKSLDLHRNYNAKESYSENLYIKNVYGHLGMLYSLKNDYSTALDYFINGLKEKKNDTVIFEHLIRIVKNEKPEDIIFLLKNIYDERSKDDVEFLVTNLSKFKMGIVLMYFHNIWLKRFGQEDITVMYMLLSIGKYDEAFKHFSEAMLMEDGEWAALYAVVAVILSGDTENANKIINLLNPSLKSIIEAYFEFNDTALTIEDLNYYINILNELILLEAMPQVDKMINLKRLFPLDVSKLVGEVLLKNMAYGKAIPQFLDALKRGEQDNAEVYFHLGYAYYKTYDYKNALDMFSKTLEHGYEKDDIYQYFYWISEQCVDEKIKAEASSLSDGKIE